jgi:hypothetical protein
MQNEFRREIVFNNKTRDSTVRELVVIENAPRLAAKNADICEYIASLALELSALSKNMNEDVLESLFNLTAQEAISAMNRKRDGVQVHRRGLV